MPQASKGLCFQDEELQNASWRSNVCRLATACTSLKPQSPR